MSLDRRIKELQEYGRKTLTQRAERSQELSQISTDGRLFASQREWDYAGEASESYINGNYRSTILCCACAVEQISGQGRAVERTGDNFFRKVLPIRIPVAYRRIKKLVNRFRYLRKPFECLGALI